LTIVADPALSLPVVTGGVDTHADVHVAAAVDGVGRQLGWASFPTTPSGYDSLTAWLASFGTIEVVGVEGTAAYGAGLTRALRSSGVRVVEVDRPDRQARRAEGKSDPLDAYAAARAALSGRASGVPKAQDGAVEMIRTLRVARASAVKDRAVALTQLKSLIKTAPEPLRSRLRALSGVGLLDVCAGLRPARSTEAVIVAGRRLPPGTLADPTAACKKALASLARRIAMFSVEIGELDDDLEPLITAIAPTLLAIFGVGFDVAGQLLTTAGDNPDRLHSEAAFAHLCGVAPIPASSGKTTRHRLNRGGDRDANCALWRIAMTRLAHDPVTHAYRDRRAKEQKTSRDITRCLKRFIAREVYRALMADFVASAGAAPAVPQTTADAPPLRCGLSSNNQVSVSSASNS
jgi:transposase